MQKIHSAVLSVPPLGMKLYKTSDGRWLGVVEIQTASGVVRIAASADEATIRRVLVSRMLRDLQVMKARGASAGFLGGLFKKIGRIAKGALGVVSNLARGRIAKALKSAVSLAKEGLPVVALGIPGLGMISGLIMISASSLLSRARKGDPNARAALTANAAQAKAGDPNALRRSRILIAAAMKQKANVRRGLTQRQPLTMGQESASELAALSGQLGRWSTAANGEPVFTPAALAGGVVWDQLRPHLGFRSDANSYITGRRAYADGLSTLASLRR